MDLVELFERGMDRALPKNINQSTFSGLRLNVGAGKKIIPGTIILDYPEWDADCQPMPYGNESVSEIFAFHFLEHVKSPPLVLQEFQRVLHSDGVVHIVVPYYSSQMQTQDLDHKSNFCEETWRVLFSNPYYNKNQIEWKFDIGLNVIIGIKERNLALITQLIKR